MVLLLGQYSTGKTTFITYLLEREFPGMPMPPLSFFLFFDRAKKKNVRPP